MCIYGWFTLLYSRNGHSNAKQLYSNFLKSISRKNHTALQFRLLQKIIFPDKGLYLDKTLVKIAQILSHSERKAKVLCGHVVKIHKNHPSGYGEKEFCVCIFFFSEIKRGKKHYSLGGTQCTVSQGLGHWHLGEKWIRPLGPFISQTEKTCLGHKGTSQLAQTRFTFRIWWVDLYSEQ